LWILDPLAEFVNFDRYKDVPARAVATNWLDGVCRIPGCRVTPLILDHPSRASMKEGHHIGGSIQLAAAFPFSATLKGGEWSGGIRKQRELTFEVLKGRYTAEGETKIVRSSMSPAFQLARSGAHVPDDHQIMVYKHVLNRIEQGLETKEHNRGGCHGPAEIAHALKLDEKSAKSALTGLADRGWIRYEASGYVLGSKAPSLADLDDF
jgi:hypothetical protein